jgi:hypothetical protein
MLVSMIPSLSPQPVAKFRAIGIQSNDKIETTPIVLLLIVKLST